MSNIVPIQSHFRPLLKPVLGNVDYLELKRQLERIDEILRVSGVEKAFVQSSLNYWTQTNNCVLEKIKTRSRIRFQKHSKQALRCNVARVLMGKSVRDFSVDLAAMPLLQWFCEMDQWGVIRVASKSSIDRYSRWLPEEMMRSVIAGLLRPEQDLGLEKPLDLESYFLDTTCVKANIHFPVDWVLLRDGVRTLMKGMILIRKEGLKRRMEEPELFLRRMNRLAIEMTHTRRKKDARREKKRVLRCMKKLMRVVEGHGRRYRDLLDQSWEETKWTRPQVNQILRRIDGVLERLPEAMRQAHERIIGERLVLSKDKILSLYEAEANVIVRGKAGSEVEFGNTLLLGETRDGLIVDWRLWKESAPADARMLKESLERVKGLGMEIKEVGGDRGFDSEENRGYLVKEKIYNGICFRNVDVLRREMKEDQFAELQGRRSQTEGRIGIFKNNFLGRPLRVKGFKNRCLSVTWAVLTHNLWVLARLPQEQTASKAG
jgi:hypothetical protein